MLHQRPCSTLVYHALCCVVLLQLGLGNNTDRSVNDDWAGNSSLENTSVNDSLKNNTQGIQENSDGNAVNVVCYTKSSSTIRDVYNCTTGSFKPFETWDKSSFLAVEGEVTCNYREVEPCKMDEPVYENGFPMHENVAAAKFFIDGPQDWLQILATGVLSTWVAILVLGIMFAKRKCRVDKPVAWAASFRGVLRHTSSLPFVMFMYWAAWGKTRRGGWFYMPYCHANPGSQEMYQLDFSYWYFINALPVHMVMVLASSTFQAVVEAKRWFDQNTVYVRSRDVKTFLEKAVKAAPGCPMLAGDGSDQAFTWRNGCADETYLHDWEQDLRRHSLHFVTLEIEIRATDLFSRGWIESSGYAFSVQMGEMTSESHSGVQVFQVIVRTHFLERCFLLSMIIPKLLMNFFMLGFVHEVYFAVNQVGTANLRLEKRVKLDPKKELLKIFGNVASTTNRSRLIRAKDFKVRCQECLDEVQMAQAVPDSVGAQKSDASKLDSLLRGMPSESAWSRNPEVPQSERDDMSDDAGSENEEERGQGAERGQASSVETRTLRTLHASSLRVPIEVSMLQPHPMRLGRSVLQMNASHNRYLEDQVDAVASDRRGTVDWDGLMRQVSRFIFMSYCELMDTEYDSKYVQDATRALVEAWELGALQEDHLVGVKVNKVKELYNKHVRQALAFLDLQRLDDLREAAESSKDASLVQELRLIDPEINNLLTSHIRHMLQMATQTRDRKALALALIEATRLGAQPVQDSDAYQIRSGNDTETNENFVDLARKTYRQKLFDDSRQVLLSDAGQELLGDGQDQFGDSWVQQQMAVSRSKQVGWLDFRSKNEMESPKFLRSLQALFDLTTRRVITRDRQGKLPTRLKVVKVKRSVNLDAYRAYHARRAEIEASMEAGPSKQQAGSPDLSGNFEDCLTTGLTGCHQTRAMREVQGVWRDSQTGARWIVDGNGVRRIAAVAAQCLEPMKVMDIQSSEDVFEIKHAEQPLPAIPKKPIAEETDLLTGDPSSDEPPHLLFETRRRIREDLLTEEKSIADARKRAVKHRQQGWLDQRGISITWYHEKTGARRKWVREPKFLGAWHLNRDGALILSTEGWLEGSKFLESSFRLLKMLAPSRRGAAWFAKELSKMKEEGARAGESSEPPYLMYFSSELYPIWLDSGGSDGFKFRSTNFTGFVDSLGTEICMEASAEAAEAQALQGPSPRQQRRTVLGRRTNRMVQPFLSKTWGYRPFMIVDLSAKELSAKANELWLFHGTREAAAECITDSEFQVKLAGTNRGTMFGPGIYMADSVTKSDEYTEPDPTGLRTMILCRCVMGRCIKQSEGGRLCMQACHAGGYHSVKGLRAYTEYIVYDENQVYAEYIIWYRRVFNMD